MIVSMKRHVGGVNQCDLDDKGRCVNKFHYDSVEHDFPASATHAVMKRMQDGPFSDSDLVRAVQKECQNLLSDELAGRPVKNLINKHKRKKAIEYDSSTRSWKWASGISSWGLL